MEIMHKIMNILLPPITFLLLVLFLPLFLVFKFLSFLERTINCENLSGKVVLITGASSGIGEHLAYEYARRGARLALAARREDKLREVADKATQLGSPDVIVFGTDVTKAEDCKQFVNEAVNHFGQLDHLVNNAGITSTISLFEDSNQLSEFVPAMDTNFWGSAYCSYYAIPHLRKTKGKIVVISSSAAWFPTPKLTFYNASKAAQISLFETLRAELGTDIGITIVTPGVIKSEMNQNLSKVQMSSVMAESTDECAKSIVNSACRGDKYLTEPSWYVVGFLFKLFYPEVLEWCFHWLFIRALK